MARWGLKECVHPQFVELAGEMGRRACAQCGEFLDDIVQESSHPERNLNSAEPWEDRPSLAAVPHSAESQHQSARPKCIELPRFRQATTPLRQYSQSLAARPQKPEERRPAAVMPRPDTMARPLGETRYWRPRTRRPRLHVSPIQRAFLERLRERFPAYLAPVFEQQVGSALLVDMAACERLLHVVPLSGRTGYALYRKVTNLLNVLQRQDAPCVDGREPVGEASPVGAAH